MDKSSVTKEGFEQFFKANKGLMHKVARKVFARAHAIGAPFEIEDVEQEATLVMIRSYNGFNPEFGFKFSTYYVRAVYHEFNRLLKPYENEIAVGMVPFESMQGEDDDSFSLESTIDGGHDSPEQILECKQLVQGFEEELSPLGQTVLNVLTDPPEQIRKEWEIQRSLGMQGRSELTVTHLVPYITKVTGLSETEVKYAGREVIALGRRLNV